MKGDIGMANYEEQVEQEAAYPIPISLYNCYRTVRHEKRGIAIRPSLDGLYRDGTVHISREMHKQCFITRRETTSGAPKPQRYR